MEAGPDALRAFLDAVRSSLDGVTAEQVAASLGDLIGEADRRALEGDFAEFLAESFRVALAEGVDGWFDDDLAFRADWGFSLGAIRVPVTIWQGGDDRMVPAAHGAWLAAHVPGARAELRPDEGHHLDRRRALRRDPGRPAGGVTHWLKALGHARGPLPARWLEDGNLRSLRRTGFPRRPRMAPGDRLVYYASVWQRVFAWCEVVGRARAASTTRAGRGRSRSSRCSWSPTSTRRRRSRRSASFARSMSQQSHIRLTPAQYERAVEALASVAVTEPGEAELRPGSSRCRSTRARI